MIIVKQSAGQIEKEYAIQVTAEHKLTPVRWSPSPNCDDRPDWAEPECIVLHCISLPEDHFGTGAPERLFMGTLNIAEHPSFADLAGVEVAPHVLIDRSGAVQQFVTFDKRAWHAGTSSWCGRAVCNNFTIGIELEGSVNTPFTQAQYSALGDVLIALLAGYRGLDPSRIVGHSEIAPGRKFDPGPHFDWATVMRRLHRDVT